MRLRLLFGIVGSSMLAVGCGQSDTGITTSVKSQLAADRQVQARQIDVETQNRVVTLRGEVRTAEEEAKALEIARNTDGVANVVDQLSIAAEQGAAPTGGVGGTPTEPGGGPLTNDVTITSTVKGKLLADPDISGLQIDVDTNNGVVTLTGKVRTQAEKTEALQLAREVEGVTTVTDRLTIGARQ